MLPAVILSARVTIDGITAANAKLNSMQGNLDKVAASAEVAGAKVDETGGKIERLRAISSVPIVQEIKIRVDDSELRNMASTGTASAGAGLIGARAGPGGGGGLGLDLTRILTGHSSSNRRTPLPWWLRLAGGGGKLPGAGSIGSFAGFGAEHFALSLGGFLGSGVAGAAGGALLGAGTLGQIGVGAGSDALVSAATIAGTKELGAAQVKVNKAVQLYGAYSTQAKKAQAELNIAMREAGPAAQAEMELYKAAKGLEHQFKEQTGGARKKSAEVLKQGIGLGEAFVPKVASAAETNLTIVNRDIKPLFKWLEGPGGMGVFDQLEKRFSQDLPTSIHAFTQAIEFVLKTISTASKYTGGFVENIDTFFTKWNEPKNFSTWETHMASLIQTFHLWMHFLKETGNLLVDIFSRDAHTGSAIVIALTEMITKADEWVNSTEGSSQLHNLFVIHKEEILALLKIVPPLVTIFRSVYMTVAPPLVHAATEILLVIAEILEAFSNTGPLARWALGIAVILAKMGLLKPIFGWLWAQLGLLPAKLGATETANAALVSSNEALAASNAALAASFEGVAAASVAASEAEVAASAVHTGQMSMMMPEAAAGGQLSLLGTVPSNTAKAAESEASTAGAGMAKGLMGGLASTLGPAAAAYGVINILTSVFSKNKDHMKEAGFELGGALIGGVAGFLVGGPLGAMLGVGLGSFGGELLAKLFEPTKKITPLQSELARTAKRVTEAYKAQGKAAAQLAGSEGRLHAAQSKSKSTSQQVHSAESKLAHDRALFGSDAQRVKRDEMLLVEAKHKNYAATKQLNAMQKLSGFQLELYRHTTVETVGADKERIQSLHESVKSLTEQYERLKQNNASWEERKPVLEHLADKEKGLETTTHSLQKILEESAVKVNPHFAKSLNNMNLAQVQFGKHLEGLKRVARESLGGADQSTRDFEQTWLNMTVMSNQHTQKWNEVTLAGIRGITGEMNKALGSLGVGKVNFHVQSGGGKGGGHKGEGKQTGGMVVPGSGSGDKVPMTAWVEPGEVVHVLNRNASADVKKLHSLEHLNSQVPRFPSTSKGYQSGGQVVLDSGVNMSMGKEPQIAADLKSLSSEVNQVVYVISGYRTPQHSVEVGGFADDPHTRGEAADIGVGAPTLASAAALSESLYKAVGLYRPFFAESAAEGNHVQLWGQQSGKGLAGIPSVGGGVGGGATVPIPKLKGAHMHGPPGQMTELSNKVFAKLTEAAQEYVKKHAPSGTGGEYISGGSGPVMAQMGKILFAHGANKIGAAGVIGNAYGESTLNPGAVGTGGGGLFGFTTPPISLANLHEYAAQMHKPWTDVGLQMQFMLEHEGQAMIPRVNAAATPGEAAQIFMEDWERPGIPRLDVREAGARSAYAAGWQEGGTMGASASKAKKETKKAVPGQVKELRAGEKAFHKGLHEIQKHHANKGLATINKAGRQIKKAEGLKPEFFANVIKETEAFQEAGEFATNAAELTMPLTVKQEEENSKLEEEGKLTVEPTPGKFRGMNQIEWLTKELGALGKLRNTLIGGAKSIGGPEKEIVKMVKDAHARMRHVIVKIRETERARKEIEKAKKTVEHRIAEIEHSQEANVHQLEHEKNTLETDLSKQEGLKQTAAVHAKIESLREQIHGKTVAINAANQDGNSGVKSLKEDIVTDNKKINAATKKLHEFENTKAGIEAFIPIVEERKANIFTTGESLTIGGSYHNKNFAGLKEVQGMAFKDNGTIIPALPNQPGGLGGDILAVQLQLRELNAPREPVAAHSTTDTHAEEMLALEKEVNIHLREELVASQAQYPVLRDFPSVGSIASVPYAGAYAMGGMVAANVGENGVETLLMPTGTNVVSNAERRSVVSNAKGGGKPHMNFEEVNFHEAENKVTGKVNGEDFEQDVESVNRKQSRRLLPIPQEEGVADERSQWY